MRNTQLNFRRNPVIPLLAITANWAIIAGCIALSLYTQSWTIYMLSVIVIGARQHALFIMVHEATHMHIAQNKRLNDWISDLFCALPLLFDTGVYRKNHLSHHRNLNSEQDPDWIRKQGRPGWKFPVSGARLALQIPLYVAFLGPLEILAVFWGFSGFGDKKRWQSEAPFLLFKLTYFVGVFGFLISQGFAAHLAMFWAVPMLFVLPFVTRVRNLSEHWAVSYADEMTSTREVRAPWLEGFLLTPHNVNYHLTHHLFPHIPFYRVREAHRKLIETGAYDGAQINSSYFFPYGDSVLRDVIHGPKPKAVASVEKAA
ncbi:MAG: fatty acid desaturase family protein [Bdellovibrionales bacterium]|nr:fatty acid desaturase family protein [Bdellovibrionales bacterium]